LKEKGCYSYENGDRNKKRTIFVNQKIDVTIFKNVLYP